MPYSSGKWAGGRVVMMANDPRGQANLDQVGEETVSLKPVLSDPLLIWHDTRHREDLPRDHPRVAQG